MTTPYSAALKVALLEGLILLEGAVTQPAGLTHDLRVARTAFIEMTGLTAEGLEEEGAEIRAMPIRRSRANVTTEQALDSLELTRRTVRILLEQKAIEPAWTDRTFMVLNRAEMRLGTQLRKKTGAGVRGLYVILDAEAAKGKDLAQLAETVLKNGARVLQLRDKQDEKGTQLTLAKQLTALCDQHKALFIMNDRADVAGAAKAHGLHVGQNDLGIEEARKFLSPKQLVGKSNALFEEAMLAQQQGADYIAVGAMFPSGSKNNTRPAGVATLRKVREQAQVPLVAIGGITEANVDEVLAAGADAIVVISAVVGASDPGQAAAQLSEKIERSLASRPATANR